VTIASFLLMIEEAINAGESTVPVTSRSAYILVGWDQFRRRTRNRDSISLTTL
jgi:hypothetical protein